MFGTASFRFGSFLVSRFGSFLVSRFSFRASVRFVSFWSFAVRFVPYRFGFVSCLGLIRVAPFVFRLFVVVNVVDVVVDVLVVVVVVLVVGFVVVDIDDDRLNADDDDDEQ